MPGQRQPTARQRVHAELRRRIIALELPPTAPLSENDLAQELGVSRTPVHESVLLLREEGLVEVFPQQGTFVAHVDADRVRLAQFLREAIECTALAAVDPTKIEPGCLAKLHANLAAQQRAHDAGDADAFLEFDDEFHRLLLQLGDRDEAWPIVHQAKSHLDRARRFGLVIHPIPHLIEQHTGVVDALASGEPGAAVDRLREHLREILNDLDPIRAANPEIFAAGAERPARAGGQQAE